MRDRSQDLELTTSAWRKQISVHFSSTSLTTKNSCVDAIDVNIHELPTSVIATRLRRADTNERGSRGVSSATRFPCIPRIQAVGRYVRHTQIPPRSPQLFPDSCQPRTETWIFRDNSVLTVHILDLARSGGKPNFSMTTGQRWGVIYLWAGVVLLCLMFNSSMLPSSCRFLLSICIGVASASQAKSDVAPVVAVKNGSYSGIHSSGYNQDFFLGIPYAQVCLSLT